MQIYTYSEARQKLASLLDQALSEGGVLIRRRDGTLFVLRPEEVTTSPLDVAGVDVDFGVDEMLSFIHEGRERRYDTEIDV
jgi:antitoxin Phd